MTSGFVKASHLPSAMPARHKNVWYQCADGRDPHALVFAMVWRTAYSLASADKLMRLLRGIDS